MSFCPTRRDLALLLSSACLLQGQAEQPYFCPMDPDIRSASAGKCPRCGMALRKGWPPLEQFSMELATRPDPPRPGREFELRISVIRERSGAVVRDFLPVHERLLHLFLVSRDLEIFEHLHPELSADGLFHLRLLLARSGMYRLLADFYPAGNVPQLAPQTLFVAGEPMPEPKLRQDLTVKPLRNLTVGLQTQPPTPIAGQKTLLFFDLDPVEGSEPYLGAWGHLLAASADLIDMMHEHPVFGRSGSIVQFNLIFPRPGYYRLWAQFQRLGQVNTSVFTVLVNELA